MKDLIIKNSNIEGKGVFANKDFKKGDLVIKHTYVKISKAEFEKLSEKEKESISLVGNDYLKYAGLAIYVNHSCEPNTNVCEIGDMAIRDIKKGEEITTDYCGDSLKINMKCKCGSKNCRKVIK